MNDWHAERSEASQRRPQLNCPTSRNQAKCTQKKRGSRLGSRAPKGRVPLIRPRRDRIMGSSILASLSEAGGNDPFLPMSGPLPPHSPDGRIVLERDPLLPSCTCVAHRRKVASGRRPPVFNDLVAEARIQYIPRIPIREAASRTGTHALSLAALFVQPHHLHHFSRTGVIGTCPTFRAAA